MASIDPLKYIRAKTTTVKDVNMFTVRYCRLVRDGRVLPRVTLVGMAGHPVVYVDINFWNDVRNSTLVDQAMRSDITAHFDGIIRAHQNGGGQVFLVLDNRRSTVKELMFVNQAANTRSPTVTGWSYAWDQGSGHFG